MLHSFFHFHLTTLLLLEKILKRFASKLYFRFVGTSPAKDTGASQRAGGQYSYQPDHHQPQHSYHQEDAKHAGPCPCLTLGGSRLCKRHLLHRLGCLLTPSTASTNESSSKQSSEKHPIACDVDIITSQTVSIPNGNRVPNVYYKHAPRVRCSGDVARMLIYWRSAKSATSKYRCRRFSRVTLTIQNCGHQPSGGALHSAQLTI